MKKLLFFSLLTGLMACQGTKNESEVKDEPQVVQSSNTGHHIASIAKVFEAHGGFDNWSALKTLSYDNGGQHTIVELQNRYTRIESENQTVGFDGERVWVNPPSENAARQRMRYNLIFYFYSFPFVVGDPGISYEDLEPIELKGKSYNAVKVSYGDGIGDSPKDNYIVLSDPETNQMHWLMYTATFGRNESSDRFSLIKYDGWQEFEGVVLPSSLQWYQYSDGVVGEPRGGARVFENIQVSKEYPSMDNFSMPEGAQDVTNPAT
ncbi:hypothetical protein BFP97_10025 [Roseivirga sp. 4D4]|uniref:DUF6503 family protein n=1 Tax=Roseivirga sp. 4D4 TaxID=1889784 RepID=UPI000853CEEA|nr:DUF6503 family protein [Roseivirga sp. 4D4]OEK01831.1 hypothetical protein BFP97_10025 [Roseivirga sp. 4D4]